MIESTPATKTKSKMQVVYPQGRQQSRGTIFRRPAPPSQSRGAGELLRRGGGSDRRRAEFKNGKKRIVKRKLYPGYICVHMCINDDTWFLVRETPGIGDFTGAAGKPTPMSPEDIARIIAESLPIR